MSNLKTFFGIFFFLLALNNLQAGCPNLAGRYVCPDLKGIPVVEILQTPATDSRIDYVFVSFVSNEDGGRTRTRKYLITDNLERTHDIYNFVYKAYCAESEDVLHYVATSHKWREENSFRYSLTENGSIMVEHTYINLKSGKTHGESHVCAEDLPQGF